MHISRRAFHLFLGAVALGGLRSSSSAYAEASETLGQEKRRSHYFFEDQTFETIFLTSLGRAYHSGANPGKALYLTRQVKDGERATRSNIGTDQIFRCLSPHYDAGICLPMEKRNSVEKAPLDDLRRSS